MPCFPDIDEDVHERAQLEPRHDQTQLERHHDRPKPQHRHTIPIRPEFIAATMPCFPDIDEDVHERAQLESKQQSQHANDRPQPHHRHSMPIRPEFIAAAMPCFPDIDEDVHERVQLEPRHDQQDPEHHRDLPKQHRRFSFTRRSSKSQTQHQVPKPESPQSQSHEPKQPHHHSFHLNFHDLSPPDLGNMVTKLLSPNAYLAASPTHERLDDAESAKHLLGKGRGKRIVRVDEVEIKEEKKEEDGAPLCREADIEGWKAGKGVEGDK